MDFKLPYTNLNFDLVSLDKFIQDQGQFLIHYAAIKCPLGMVNENDIRSPHNEHSLCQGGYIYKCQGVVKAAFVYNATNATLTDAGILDGSTVNTVFPRYYHDNPQKEVFLQIYDKFYLQDVSALCLNTQLLTSNPSGVDRLSYEAEEVQYVIDANGKEYSNNDFTIKGSFIHWGANRPPFDAELNVGTVYSVRYLFKPHWYVQRLVHEVRIANQKDFLTGKQIPVRAPYAAFLTREFAFQGAEKVESLSSGIEYPSGNNNSIFGPK